MYVFIATSAHAVSTVRIRGFSSVVVIFDSADFRNDDQLFSVDMSDSVAHPRATLTLNCPVRVYQVFDNLPGGRVEVRIVLFTPRRG